MGIAAKQAGLSCVLLDRRTVVSTIERYPLAMTFFSTPERIEIGGVPFIASHEKPTRQDGLIYYRRVAEHYGLDIRPGEDVVDVEPEKPDGSFRVRVARRHDSKAYRTPAVVFATGYYDNPNYLRVPGEDLPHVTPLLRRGTSLLASAGDRDRSGEQQRRRRAGVLACGRHGDAGAFW